MQIGKGTMAVVGIRSYSLLRTYLKNLPFRLERANASVEEEPAFLLKPRRQSDGNVYNL
jgi:hypothetical protein